ncbi:MAG: hypothetical protein WA985_05195 [Erythrobacter sp.]
MDGERTLSSCGAIGPVMRLIIHPGLHKTGSTYLQHVLNDTSRALTEKGVWYERQRGYPAHHGAAWRILIGDPKPLIRMGEKAEQAGCETLILSSEDLEGALYDDRPLAAIERAVGDCGIDTVEWHVVLRDPGQAFASLFAQLQHHVYADAFQLFYDVMRRGFVHMAAPMPDAGTPYWHYAFDHLADLERLKQRTGAQVVAHDFAAEEAFPGAPLLRHLDCAGAIEKLPGPAARNARPAREDIIRGFVERVAEAVPDTEGQRQVTEGFLACLESGLANVSTYAELVGARYAASHRGALERFGVDASPT